jgi:hypothetical protein
MGGRKMDEATLTGEVESAVVLGLDFTVAMCPWRPALDKE